MDEAEACRKSDACALFNEVSTRVWQLTPIIPALRMMKQQRTLLWWHWRDLPTMIFPVLVLFSTLLCHIAIAGRTCPKPDDLPFAVVVPLKTFYEPGEQIVYSCKPGYVSRGGMRRFTCPLTGMWPINTLKCTRRVCPFAGILENGIVRYTSFEYPNTINFTCNPGFYLNGTSSSKCNEEGKWSPELPVCVPMACPPPPVPKSATLKAHKSLAGNTSLYGDTEVFECLPQHAMFGNDTITCTAHGNWTKLPECKASCKISIKKATVLYQGMRVKIQDQFKDGMKHGDKVSFFCKNKEKKCSYTEEANCIDGTLEIPKCFKEHSSLAFWKTDAWDVKPC
ncbi:beta-2-glycoprotein 1 isoform X2 [Peromyscus maniculatus bairdii]|uniref:beta-2-glycoprotein 1 isoform X2 n=1 Tax=Peromyscus maniculatus bairdii TaxID=230844 RepID=UPI003FD2B155